VEQQLGERAAIRLGAGVGDPSRDPTPLDIGAVFDQVLDHLGAGGGKARLRAALELPHGTVPYTAVEPVGGGVAPGVRVDGGLDAKVAAAAPTSVTWLGL
jgi:hypothetical protein